MMKRKTILAAVFLAAFSIQSFAAYQPPFSTAALQASEKKTLTYTKDLSSQTVEAFLGRKMTFLEKVGFKLNKKKFVETTNMFSADAAGDAANTTNGWAIAGFVSSLLIAPLGIVFSAIALGQIKKTGQKGRGLAIAGLIIGIVFTAILLLG